MGVSFPRRRFLQLAAAAALPIAPQAARAEAFPTRPLRLMVGFPPGGIGDIITRMLASPLQDRLGQPVVVENRSGAGGNVATEYVVRSAPDGYTLMCSGPFNTINATLYDNLSFDYIRDIAMVASVMRGPLVMAIDPSLRVTSVADFITYAKANPDKVNMASSGNGTAPHLAGELFSMMTGVKMVHVPYRGDGPSLADVVSGQLQVVFANLPPAIGHISCRPVAGLGGDDDDAVAGAALHAAAVRHGAGLRRRYLVRARRAEGDAATDDRDLERRDQCLRRRSRLRGPARRLRHRADAAQPAGVRRLRLGRRRQMGQWSSSSPAPESTEAHRPREPACEGRGASFTFGPLVDAASAARGLHRPARKGECNESRYRRSRPHGFGGCRAACASRASR